MKKFSLLLICIISISLTGCMKKYPLSEANTNIVAEYMAGMLLKYDKNYSSSLINYRETDEISDTGYKEDREVETVKESEDNENDIVNNEENNNESNNEGNTQDTDYALSEIIGKQDFDIQYTGYRTADALSDNETNSVFSVEAKEGYTFFVAEFSVENKTDRDKVFDLSKSTLKYRLDINNETTYKPQSVLLENNLLFININVKAGEKISAILVFEVPENMDTANIDLNIFNDEMTKTISIK